MENAVRMPLNRRAHCLGLFISILGGNCFHESVDLRTLIAQYSTQNLPGDITGLPHQELLENLVPSGVASEDRV